MDISLEHMTRLLAIHRETGADLADKVFAAADNPEEALRTGARALECQGEDLRGLYAEAGLPSSSATAQMQVELCRGFYDRASLVLGRSMASR